jgi:hypothetical protein
VSDHHIQLLMLVVQALAFGGLVVYCFETYKMRKAAQGQVKVSQDLIGTAMDQVEGMSKPCLTIWGALRDGADAILEMHGAAGNIVAGADQGGYVIHNIGNGVAMNIRYFFTRPTDDANRHRRWKYIPYLMPSGRTTLTETINLYNTTHEVTIEYSSSGGRQYLTSIQLNHNVITSFRFEEIKA